MALRDAAGRRRGLRRAAGRPLRARRPAPPRCPARSCSTSPSRAARSWPSRPGSWCCSSCARGARCSWRPRWCWPPAPLLALVLQLLPGRAGARGAASRPDRPGRDLRGRDRRWRDRGGGRGVRPPGGRGRSTARSALARAPDESLAVGTLAAVVGVAWLDRHRLGEDGSAAELEGAPHEASPPTAASTGGWRVDSFAAHPLTGVGAGSFGVEWRRERESDDFAQDAHSLYLETLAELGLVGGVAARAFLGAVLLGVARSGPTRAIRSHRPRRPAWRRSWSTWGSTGRGSSRP